MARRAVVSGGGTGIGKAVARRLAAGGDTVVVLGRRADVLSAAAEEINTELGALRVSTAAVDLTAPEQVQRLAAQLGADGAVDVVVNNAGGNFGGEPADLAGVVKAWEADFQGNVLTAVLLTQALMPYLARPGGRIIAVSSIAALCGPAPTGRPKPRCTRGRWGWPARWRRKASQ